MTDPTPSLEARRQARLLHEVAAVLSRCSSQDEVGGVIVQQISAGLGAESAVAYFTRPDGSLGLGAARGLTEEALARVRTLSLDAPLPLATAVRTGESVWLESREALLRAYPEVRNAKTPGSKLQAVAALPLCSSGRTLGGLAFSFASSQRFDEDERTFFLTLSHHAALAAERCLLLEEERAARARLALLAEASRRFAAAPLDLRDTLDTVAREVAARLRDCCAINLLSADEQILDAVAVAHVDPALEAAIRRTLAAAPVRMAEASAPVRVVRSGEPLLIPVIPRQAWLESIERPEYREHHEKFPISTLLIVPLRARGKIIGSVTTARGPGAPAYTRQDQLLLEDLADRAGFAIANARQHEELLVERGRLEVLARASETLASSLDYETTLRNVIDLALPACGDFGFFDVIEPNGEVRRLARAHENPECQALIEQTRWVRSERTDKNLCALSSGASGFHPDVDEAWLLDVAASPEHLSLMQQLGFRSMITVPLPYHGMTLGALTLFFSTSGRRHTHGDLHLAEELARRAAAAVENARLFKESREAIAVRDDFLSIAGHELNTPLAALQLQLQSLKRQAHRDGVSSWFLERIAKTEAHVARLEKLISELLDVSRMTGGRLSIDLERVDLTLIVKDVIERLSAHAGSAGCTLFFSGREGIRGQWDRVRLEQVMVNLVGNSIKYGPGQPIEISVSAENGKARLSVRDFGIGVAPEDEQRIFGRFERAVSARNYGGLGLGLWIARQIVQAHGGSIWFERPSERGTRFVVELPLEAPRATEARETRAADKTRALNEPA